MRPQSPFDLNKTFLESRQACSDFTPVQKTQQEANTHQETQRRRTRLLIGTECETVKSDTVGQNMDSSMNQREISLR